MGRKIKYKTTEERQTAQRRWRREYYHRNKKSICKKYMEKYYDNK